MINHVVKVCEFGSRFVAVEMPDGLVAMLILEWRDGGWVDTSQFLTTVNGATTLRDTLDEFLSDRAASDFAECFAHHTEGKAA